MRLEAVPAAVSTSIEVSESGATLVLRIRGELDGASRTSIEPALMAAMTSSGSMILDLGELSFCDSSGVAMFIAAFERARTQDSSLAIRNVQPLVRRLFEITNVDHMIEIID
jgi:anti-sigma B factor antagonist